MLMFKNEVGINEELQRLNDSEMEASPVEDMEINCVFCGMMFDSIDGVQNHITDVHENNNPAPTEVRKIKSESVCPTPIQIRPYLPMPISDKLTVFDADMNIVNVEDIKLDLVKHCMRCNRHFVNEECLSHHQFKEHAIRKRKRSTHPNCVEGIVVTLEGTWGCDVCTRVFATLKQAKVHKFKSHIEPVQKQEMLSTDFTKMYPGLGDESATQQYEQNQHSESPTETIPLAAASPSNSNETNQSESNTNGMDLSQSVSPAATSNHESESVWKVKLSDTRDTKISFSKVLEEKLKTKEEPSQNSQTFFAFNSSTSQYACSHCPAMFSSRAVYSRHILVHRRGKAFVCESCGMAFTRNHTLKQHRDSKCVIASPILGVNCQTSDQCPKCGIYFASSNSHLSHCKNICKVVFGNSTMDSTKDSIKSEETNPQCEAQMDIEVDDNDRSNTLPISDFINNPAFVTKRTNEFNCNLCLCYFPSFKSIGLHLEQYHRIKSSRIKSAVEGAVKPLPAPVNEYAKIYPSETQRPLKLNEKWWSNCGGTPIQPRAAVTQSPPPKMLKPSNFTILPIIGMTNGNDILNLSKNHYQTLIRAPSFSPMEFKPRMIRKAKVQPNLNGEFECTECHKAFGCRSSLSNHIKSHFNLRNKPFTCLDCNEGFMSNVSYDEHIKSLCPKVFKKSLETSPKMSSPMIFNVNGSSPSTGRATSCMHCNMVCPDRSLLEDHAAREHANENGEVQCIMCTRSFSTYMAFRVHMTKSHGGPNGTPLKNSLNVALSQPYLSTFSSLPIGTMTSSPIARYDGSSSQFLESQRRPPPAAEYTPSDIEPKVTDRSDLQ